MFDQIIEFDEHISHWLNHWIGTWPRFDQAVLGISSINLVKTVPALALLFFYWYRKDFGDRLETDARHRTRQRIIGTVCAVTIALLAGRVLALTLPYRPRPATYSALQTTPIAGLHTEKLDDWSSFPSDHMVLMGAISVGLCTIRLAAGFVTTFYSVGVVGFPRLYLGLHYPSDLLVGFAVGATFALANEYLFVRSQLYRRPVEWGFSNPSLFAVIFFVISFEMASLFKGSRAILGLVSQLLR